MADKAHAQISIRLYWLVRPRRWLPVNIVVWRIGRYWCCGIGAFGVMLWISTLPPKARSPPHRQAHDGAGTHGRGDARKAVDHALEVMCKICII